MLIKLLRSVLLGLVIALLIMLAVPRLRPSNITGWFPLLASGKSEATVISFSHGVRRAAPAVVNVYNRNTNTANQQGMTTLGSGVIMDSRGYILTNRHVVSNANQIIVALQDGRFFEAMLIGSDNMTDLAVLKINANNLPTIPINPKRTPHVGDLVMAIGNPYNLGQTVTQGIISATGRIGLSSSGRQNFLQTDASINQGNSGGALINSLGELVGINTLTFDKASDGETPEGIGFAIPSILSLKIMDKLIRDGRVIRGFIGITVQEIPALQGEPGAYEKMQGLVVSQVTGPAKRSGVQTNDILLSVNNIPALSAQETMDQVAEIRPNSVINVEVQRQGKKLKFPVTIAEYPTDSQNTGATTQSEVKTNRD